MTMMISTVMVDGDNNGDDNSHDDDSNYNDGDNDNDSGGDVEWHLISFCCFFSGVQSEHR